MSNFTAIASLSIALLLTAACQHSPTWEAGMQRSRALSEEAVPVPVDTMEEDLAVLTEQAPQTRVWLLPISAVGSVDDDHLDSQLAEVLRAIGQWQHIERIDIVGHTDDQGSDEFNQRLSVKRADRVAERLIMAGLDQQLIAHGGEGELQPLADNSSEQGRAVNRRVEVRVTGLGPLDAGSELALGWPRYVGSEE